MLISPDRQTRVLSAVFFALLAGSRLNVDAVDVDIFQTMENGNPGELLTTPIMDGSSQGGCSAVTATWSFKYGDQMWVSDEHARTLPGSVAVGGTSYNGDSSRTWRFRNREELECVIVDFGTTPYGHPYHDKMTVAGYYTTEQTGDQFMNQHDNIELASPQSSYGVLQARNTEWGTHAEVRAHSQNSSGTSTVSDVEITLLG
jgi:hypothetical protein